MAGVPPLKNSTYSFEVSLVDQSDTDTFKSNPTLAAGDVTVSKDGGSFANIDSLPTAIDAGSVLTVALTATEMNADRVAVLFNDAAGDEWQDLLVVIETDTRQLNDVATETKQDTIDTVVDAILVDTGTSIPAEIEGVDTDVWTYGTRTLTTAATSGYTANEGGALNIKRGDTMSTTLTDLGDLSARSKLWFTVKTSKDQADSEAIIRIEEAAGLEYLNGAAATVAGNGSITVDDESDGDITVTLKPAETDDLVPAANLYYDVQMLTTTGTVSTLTGDVARVTADVTRTVS